MPIKRDSSEGPNTLFAIWINEILMQACPDAPVFSPAIEESRLMCLIAAATQTGDSAWEQCYDVFKTTKKTKVSELLDLMLRAKINMAAVYTHLVSCIPVRYRA